MVPYPCDLDWYCYDGSSWDLGLDIDVPAQPGPPPDRPDIGRPGRPDIGLNLADLAIDRAAVAAG